MGSSTTTPGAPAQVVYHASPGEREWRTEVALMRLRVAGAMAGAITELAPDDAPTITTDLLGAPRPSVPIGTTVGPTHTRRSRARARVLASGEGLPITHARSTGPKPGPASSHLDVAPRCTLTDLLTPTCAHCLGHATDLES